MPALLDQDARDIGGYAEADVDRVAIAQLLRHAPRDHLGDIEFWRLERGQRPEDFARDGWLVRRVRRLQLIRRDHDKIDKYAGHDDIVRPQRSATVAAA